MPLVGDAHGLSPRATSNCIHDVADAICNEMPRFIHWPDEHEMRNCKVDFYQHEQWPSIVGLIDGTQVPLNTPFLPANEAVYVNRKGFHAINVQIVCDRRLKIYSLDARFPGSCHDAYILRNSRVWERLEENAFPNSWLLGDSGYPLKSWLLTPFQNPTTPAEELYNARHRQIRSSVERCNGVLKMRWRCLTKPIMFQPRKASKVIAACGALHNFALAHNVELPEDVDLVNMDAANFPNDGEIQPRDNEGIRTRQRLVHRLFNR